MIYTLIAIVLLVAFIYDAESLVDRSYGYYDLKEEAEVFSKKWHAEHDPRPGHQACDYCGKQVADTAIHRATIWRNHAQEQRKFCNPSCAAYDQMASEG